MGMFDSVIVKCPDCGNEIEFQSKGGVCELERYTDLSNIPIGVASDVSSPEICYCGLVCHINIPKNIAVSVEYLHYPPCPR